MRPLGRKGTGLEFLAGFVIGGFGGGVILALQRGDVSLGLASLVFALVTAFVTARLVF